MTKQVTSADFKRLEHKIDRLNEKLDRIMAAQGIPEVKGEDPIQKEEGKKRKARERKQQKWLEQEQFQQHVLQGMKDSALRMGVGKMLQHQFGLLQAPSASRIRKYQRTKDPRAFDGLRRVGLSGKK